MILITSTEVPLAVREESRKRWLHEIDKWQSSHRPQFVLDVFFDLYGVSCGCCSEWWKNIWRCFAAPGPDRLVYFPYDITYLAPSPGMANPGLQEFIDRMNDSDVDLLMGTYKLAPQGGWAFEQTEPEKSGPGDSTLSAPLRKHLLETYTISRLWERFPQCMRWYCSRRAGAQGDPIPRTGFFGLTGRLFDAFVGREGRHTMLPWTGTVQMLICAIMHNRVKGGTFNIAEQCIGTLRHSYEPLTDYEYRHQIRRVAFVIADEADYWLMHSEGQGV